MNENVIKFRRIEKKPEPPVKKPRGPLPGWAVWLAFLAIIILVYAVQRSGLLG